MAFSNSSTEPGQPWVSTSGNASSCGDRTCRKWMPTPSISVRNWGSLFNLRSVARQSYSVAQYSHSSRRYASGTPCDQSATGSASGHLVRRSRSVRSARSASGMSMRNGITCPPVQCGLPPSWVPRAVSSHAERNPKVPSIPSIKLNNGVEMPQLGYGVFQVPRQETYDAVTEALRAGYRSIDTAAAYGNEEGVGRAIADSGIARDDLFVTTKLWNADHGYDEALRAFDRSSELLGLEQLDLYLIHWPAPQRDRYVDTWRAFAKLVADGRLRAAGVSNFQPVHLERIIQEVGLVPA